MLFFFSLELSRKIGIGLIDKFLYFNRLILVFLKDTLLFLRIFRRETGNFVRIFVRKGFFFEVEDGTNDDRKIISDGRALFSPYER